MFLFLLLIGAFCQNCGDGDVICVGDDGDYATFSEGFGAMPPMSPVKYVMITSDMYLSNETVYPLVIDATISSGTFESPITIMPDPAAPGQVTVWFDKIISGDFSVPPFVFQQPYWVVDGVGEKLRLAWTHDNNQDRGTGYLRVSGVGTGKFTVREVLFENFRNDHRPCGIYIYCDRNQACDDTDFDDINILYNTFVSEYYSFTAIKVGIESASALTMKVSIVGNHIYTRNGYYCTYAIFFPYAMRNYLDTTREYMGGCQNCFIGYNDIESCYRGIYARSRLEDTMIIGNTMNDIRGPCMQFSIMSGFTQYPSLKNVIVEDNCMDCEDGGFSVDDYTSDGSLAEIRIEYRHNELSGGQSDACRIQAGHSSMDVLVDGNTFATDLEDTAELIDLECYWSESFHENIKVTFTNNVFKMDFMERTPSHQKDLFDVYSCGYDLTVAYNLFEVYAPESFSYPQTFLVPFVYGTEGFDNLVIYGNVILANQSVPSDFFYNNVSMSLEFDTYVLVAENLYNIDYNFDNSLGGFFDDPGVYYGNEYDLALEEFDYENNICSMQSNPQFQVPYMPGVTPLVDMEGEMRATSGMTIIGPRICSSDYDDDFFVLERSGSNESEYGCSPSAMPPGRSRGAGFYFRNDYLYIFGGLVSDNEGGYALLNDVWRVSTTWQNDFNWCFLKGNYSSMDDSESVFVTKGEFDEMNDVSARASFSAFSIYHSFFVFGGEVVGGVTTNELWEFNVFRHEGEPPTENQWRILAEEDDFILYPDLPTSRMGHCAGHFGETDDMVYIFGGKSSPSSDDPTYYNDLYLYNIMNNEWVKLKNATSQNESTTFGVLDRFVVENEYTLKDFEDFNLNPPERTDCICWVDLDRHFYIFGGSFPNEYVTNDVWKYNLTNWGFIAGGKDNLDNLSPNHHQYDPLNLPAVRSSSIFFTNQMKYNTDGGNSVIFFGGMQGREGRVFGDMWQFSNQWYEFRFLNGSSDGVNIEADGDFIGSRSGGIGVTKPSFRVLIFGGSSLG